MPVSKISSVFPSFYSTNYTLGVPAANTALERSSLGNLTFDISHALCFRRINNISVMPSASLSGPCVVLSNYSLGDFSSNSSGHPCFGLRDIFYPINFKRNVSGLPTPPRPAPLCWKTPQSFKLYLPLPWGNCAPKEPWKLEGDKYLWWFGHRPTFKNSLGGAFDYSYRNPNMAGVSPTFTGMFLCGPRACTDIRPLALQRGLAFNATARWNTSDIFETPLQINYAAGMNFSIVSLACVLPPFMFVSFNGSVGEDGVLNCSSSSCFLSNCWSPTDESMLMVRIPALVPLVVEDPHDGRELILYRERRDFGITAAVIAAIAISATAATVAGITVSQSAATAETVNTLAARVTQALETQNTINSHIQLGMLNLNQQTALLQEQINVLWMVQQASCSHFYHSACVTLMEVKNMSFEVQRLNAYLRGPWNDSFVNFTHSLVHQIIAINETRVEPVSAEGWWNTMAQIGGWAQRWGGALSLGILGLVGVAVGLLLLKRVLNIFTLTELVHRQVLLSLTHDSPGSHEVWLQMLKK